VNDENIIFGGRRSDLIQMSPHDNINKIPVLVNPEENLTLAVHEEQSVVSFTVQMNCQSSLVDTSWGSAIGENLWFVALMAVVAVGAVLAVRAIRPKLPPPDWGFTIDVDRTIDRQRVVAPSEPAWHPVLSWYMTEKVLLVAAVTGIFVMVLPGNEVSVLGVIGPVAFVILFNSFAGSVLTRRGHTAASIWAAAAFSWVVNLVAMLLFIWLVRNADERINEFALLFYVTLLTLIVALFDWFHRRGPAAAMRREAGAAAAVAPA
jgi:hypothetical protein